MVAETKFWPTDHIADLRLATTLREASNNYSYFHAAAH